jgi:hypothetical protein
MPTGFRPNNFDRLGLPKLLLTSTPMGYTFRFIFHPAVNTLAAAYENAEMTRAVPENNIMGPKPLANEPSIWRAPDIGIPVNPAMDDTPRTNPSLL